MKIQLKPLARQVVVITGATSGVGLVTARKAAQRGARLVLTARNGAALDQLQQELSDKGAPVAVLSGDVGEESDLRKVAALAIERFGGFDTWVNNAGVAIFGRLADVPRADHERLFATNFWGIVHGSLIALDHLGGKGGALINLGSEVSDRAVPLQGMYSASKHAVKGFTDALRQEIEAEGLGVSVTLIKPAALDTMFVAHARNYMDVEPRLPAPVYAPDLAADAILFAAEHPRRDLFVGGAAKAISSGAHFAPRLLDKYMERFMIRQQRTLAPAVRGRDSLYASQFDLREREGMPLRVRETSWYDGAMRHPRATALVATVAGALLAAAVLGGQSRTPMLKSARP